MRCGRELGAAQSQGLLAAAFRAMLNLRLATIVHGSFETLGLPPLWGGGVRSTSSRHVSFAARHGEVATGWPLCHLSAKVMVGPGTVPKVGLMVVSVSPPHHRDRRQSLLNSPSRPNGKANKAPRDTHKLQTTAFKESMGVETEDQIVPNTSN